MIWVIGGTSESREVVRQLIDEGFQVVVTVATPRGKALYPEHSALSLVVGGLDVTQMQSLITTHNIELIIDVSHPYAEEVSRNAEKAAILAGGLPLYKYTRPAITSEYERTIICPTYDDAVAYSAAHEGNVLLTTGVRHLAAFAAIPRERLFVKVLPLEESIKECFLNGIISDNIIALRGIVQSPLLTALIDQFSISILVTKDTGNAGGFAVKTESARRCGIDLVVISRPQEDGNGCNDIAQLIAKVRSSKNGQVDYGDRGR